MSLSVTLDEEVHRGGPRPAAGLDGAHVLAFIRHVHVLDLDGELLLIQGHQLHPWIHRPLIFPGEQYAGPVEPRRVRDHLPLCAPAAGQTDQCQRQREPNPRPPPFLFFSTHVCVIFPMFSMAGPSPHCS